MSKKNTSKDHHSGVKEYRYLQEISQMLFVNGENPEPRQDTVQLVEDIVRLQIVNMVIEARQQAQRRGSKSLSAEDVMFLVRGDRRKVNRVRTFLSWKEVRKKAKEAADAGQNIDEVEIDDPAAADHTTKATKITVKVPWEITTVYKEFLRKTNAYNSDDEEDEDDQEASEEMKLRLKDADEATRGMTGDEYQHYADCRQASFTYRKSKRFREFVNFAAYLDVKPNDDIVDILGFLATEMVRSLCLGGLEVKRMLEESKTGVAGGVSLKRKLAPGSVESPTKRPHLLEADDDGPGLPREVKPSIFAKPPAQTTPLRPFHIQEAFARMQRDSTHARTAGMRNWRGGLIRTRMNLI